MKKNLIICLLVAGLAAFEFSSKSQTGRDESPVLITEMSLDEFHYTKFNYDGNKLLETVEYDRKSIYQYTGNFITRIQEYHYNELISTADFTYNNEGNLEIIKMVGIDENVGPNRPYKNTYTIKYPDSNNTISTFSRNYIYTNEIESDSIITNFKTIKGNIVLNKDFYIKDKYVDLQISQKSKFDNKNNPFSNILGFDKIRVYNAEHFDELAIGKNNILSYTMYKDNVPLTKYGSYAYFTYTYNKRNYPTKRVSKYYNRDGILAENNVIHYTYNK